MDDRTLNLTGKQFCRNCEDGFAIVSYRTFGKNRMPEYGPCPHCELGARLEFPTGVKGPKGEPGARPSWGRDGYWQGRRHDVEPPPPDGKLLPREENLLRLKLLNRRLAGENVDPCVGLDMRDPARRIEMLKRALAS